MIVNTQADFDLEMQTATATTIIELPGGTINWPLTITKPCTILGSDTIIDLIGLNIDYAITISDACDLSGIAIHTDQSGIFVENGANISAIVIEAVKTGMYISGHGDNLIFEEIQVSGCEHGFIFHDARKYSLSACSATKCQVGFEFEGTSSELGDSLLDPAAIAGISVPEADRTNRTHLIQLSGCLSFDNKFGIRFINSNHITFDSSNVHDNESIGIWQMPASYSNSFNGEIYSNIAYGIKNVDREGNLHDFDARQVWWGDITGPSGYGKGSGQKISTNVNFEPWLRDGTDPDILLYPQTRQWIWSSLGYPIVRVELTETMVTECIDMAIDKFMYYQTPKPDWGYGYIGAGTSELDLAQLKDSTGAALSIKKDQVIEVAYQPYNDIFSNLTGAGTDFFLTYYIQNSGDGFLSDFYMTLAYKDDMERTMGINPTYEFLSHLLPSGLIKEVVRLYPRPDNSVKIGVKYSRPLTQAEVDNYTWIRKYALAWAKEKLGRIRSKFGTMPSPTGETSLDGPTLLSESMQEKTDLITELLGLVEPLTFQVF